ncbi:MAG: DNA-processing protein DprA [Rhodoferax sp.]
MERDELAAWLRLALTPGVGNASARKLLAAFGPPPSVFGQSHTALRQLVNGPQAEALLTEPPGLAAQLETTWQWLQAAAPGTQRWVLALDNAEYPDSLLNIEDPPLMLYLLGARNSEGNKPPAQTGSSQHATHLLANDLRRSLAIVGSRNPTPQGAVHARQFARAFSEAGLTVISGLALGIDGEAHLGALEGAAAGGQRLATVAVVGTGLDRVYPQKHLELAHQIARHGLIISEFPIGTPPLAANFPKRNRILAGLASGTLVVEAALQSGSLITARLAAEQGKEVFAIPGSIASTQSRGCHALIRQGAKLVETAQDVLEELRLPFAHASSTAAIDTSAAPTEPLPEHSLLRQIGYEPVSLDALQARTGLATAQLQARLLELELDGRIARLPGGLFQRMGRG